MFMILLRFAQNRAAAPGLMEAHNAWLNKGFAEGAFMLAGSIRPRDGGAILAQGGDRSAIEARIAADPFVAEGVVRAEILEVTPSRTDARLSFLAA